MEQPRLLVELGLHLSQFGIRFVLVEAGEGEEQGLSGKL
jgi:hypothetical protein